MDVGPRREVLVPVPGAAAGALQLGREGFFIPPGGVQSDHAASIHRHEGVIVLVDSGAEEAPAEAALRLRVEAGQLPRQQLVLLFVRAAVPATRCHSGPGAVAAQAFHIGNHLFLPSDWLDPDPGSSHTLLLLVPKSCQLAPMKTGFPARKPKARKSKADRNPCEVQHD